MPATLRICALFGLLAAASPMAGCAVVGDRRVPVAHFTDAQVKGILPGETMRRELLDRLGPPDGIVRDGASQPLPPGGVGAGAVAYRYDSVESSFTIFLLCGQNACIPIPTEPVLKSRTLWVLLDEGTGRVTRREVGSAERKIPMSEVPWPDELLH
ncbi:MAG TPA: hypothetical protein VIU29_03295 [Candidatus Deferrimicrobiaceae bacterium]